MFKRTETIIEEKTEDKKEKYREPKSTKPSKSSRHATGSKTPSKSERERFYKWYQEFIMGREELTFTIDEITNIAYYCLVYQQSHSRSKGKDPADGGEAKYYHDAGKIRDKIKAFLQKHDGS